MNLREEIYSRIKQSFPHNNPNTIVFVSREITNIFEKRIDIIKPDYDKIMSLDTSRGQVEYIEGFTDVIKIVKEMLK